MVEIKHLAGLPAHRKGIVWAALPSSTDRELAGWGSVGGPDPIFLLFPLGNKFVKALIRALLENSSFHGGHTVLFLNRAARAEKE